MISEGTQIVQTSTQVSPLAALVGGFILGLIVGWMTKGFFNTYVGKSLYNIKFDSNDTLRVTIGLMLTIAYVIMLISTIVDKDFEIPIPVHATIGGMVGFIFKAGGLKINNKSKDDVKNSSEE